MLKLVKPRHFLPVHGEYAFLCAHAQLALDLGFRNTSVIRNGQMLGVSPMRNGRTLSSGSATVRLCCSSASSHVGQPITCAFGQTAASDALKCVMSAALGTTSSYGIGQMRLCRHSGGTVAASCFTRAAANKRHVRAQLSKAQYDAAFGDQARPSGDSTDEAAAEQSAPAAADEATGAIIGEVDLEIFYNDGNKVRNSDAHSQTLCRHTSFLA